MAEPYIPFYPADYLADTMHLSLEENGAYIKLLFAMWRMGGELPDDDKKISLILGITINRWQRLKPALSGFFTYDGGVFYQKRLRSEMKFVRQKSEKNRESGKRGGIAKSMKNKNTNLANATISLGVSLQNLASESLASRAVLRTPDSEEVSTGILPSLTSPPTQEKNNLSVIKKNPLPPKTNGEQKRGTRLQADWDLPRSWGEWAMQEMHLTRDEVLKECDKFKDYWIAKPGPGGIKLDWQATWRNWIRASRERILR